MLLGRRPLFVSLKSGTYNSDENRSLLLLVFYGFYNGFQDSFVIAQNSDHRKIFLGWKIFLKSNVWGQGEKKVQEVVFYKKDLQKISLNSHENNFPESLFNYLVKLRVPKCFPVTCFFLFFLKNVFWGLLSFCKIRMQRLIKIWSFLLIGIFRFSKWMRRFTVKEEEFKWHDKCRCKSQILNGIFWDIREYGG